VRPWQGVFRYKTANFVEKYTDMTQLLLEVPQHQDLDLLLALFKRLDIRVVQRTVSQAAAKTEDPEAAFILAGLPAKEDFEAYVREFEESRQDKPLPLREN